jgi:uncharacterized repeat protein (TIGR02543 family)
MATVTKWTPFGVALDITATGGTVTRTSATKYTVKINASWETYYSGAQTNYGMTASSGGGSATLNNFGTKSSSGSGSFTGTYSISGNGAATKTVTVTFRNFNNDNGDSATKTVSFSVSVPAWTSYTVTFNANGGSGAPGKQTKWKDQTLVLSSTKPTRTGYSFLGWSTSSSATSATYSAGGNYTANSAATLYAVWKANTYTVSYNANGGSGAPGNQTKTYGQTLVLSSTKPTRTNYNFKGWGTSASSTTVSYAAGANYTANAAITLYAIWELAYIKPRISNLKISRTDTNGTEADDGTSAKIAFNWVCDKAVSSITIKWKLSSDSTYANSSTLTASGTSGSVSKVITNYSFSVESSYDIQITVTDSGGNSLATGMLPSMKLSIDFMPEGKGAAVGKAAEKEGVFDIAYKTRLLGGLEYVILGSGTDLNTLLTPNFYAGNNASSAGYINCPITSGSFTLDVISAGPNGQIYQRLTLCDKTKPAVYERFYYTSAWGSWTGGWIYPTLSSDFVMYGTDESANKPRYRKDGRVVEVRGIVKPSVALPKSGETSTTIYNIFTLPAGYRPSSPIYTICQGSGNYTWLLRVNNDGGVGFSRYRNGGTSASVDTGTWLPFQITFLEG